MLLAKGLFRGLGSVDGGNIDRLGQVRFGAARWNSPLLSLCHGLLESPRGRVDRPMLLGEADREQALSEASKQASRASWQNNVSRR